MHEALFSMYKTSTVKPVLSGTPNETNGKLESELIA